MLLYACKGERAWTSHAYTVSMTSSTTSFRVTGMTCGHCAKTVERAAGSVAGVAAARVHFAQGLLTVEGAADARAIAAAVREAGYEAEEQ